MTHWLAPEAELMAWHELIPLYHPQIQDVSFVFTPRLSHQGEVALGKARIISGIQAFLLGSHQRLVVELHAEAWDQLSRHQQLALLDHELSHFVWHEEREEFRIRPHDIEEFFHIANRYGDYRADLEMMRVAMQVPAGEL